MNLLPRAKKNSELTIPFKRGRIIGRAHMLGGYELQKSGGAADVIFEIKVGWLGRVRVVAAMSGGTLEKVARSPRIDKGSASYIFTVPLRTEKNAPGAESKLVRLSVTNKINNKDL